MKNKKGYANIIAFMASHLVAAGIPVIFKAAFGVIALAAIWHIPAWERAKSTHTEEAYQSQQMWPQQLFSKLPGGTISSNSNILMASGNAGNFKNGSSN